MRPIPVLALAGALIAGPVAALGPLKDVSRISEGLIATGIAYEIGTVCDEIGLRWIRGVNYLEGLKDHARGLGYTEDQIDAYIDDRAEKRRLEAEARARLAAMGAVEGQPDTYCSVGRAEIAADSAIGRLLR